jgi:hypothetical protein
VPAHASESSGGTGMSTGAADADLVGLAASAVGA